MNLRHVFLVRIKLNAARLKKWYLGWQLTFGFILTGKLSRLHLARLNVRLIESVDSNDRARNRSCNFPAEEFLPERVNIVNTDAHHRMPRLFKGHDGFVLRLVRPRCQTQVSKDAILAIHGRPRQALAIHGNDTLPVFSCRFGNQLFEPSAKIRNSWRSDDSQLVASMS